MGRGLRELNHSNQVAIWSERVVACRRSGVSVSQWCEDQEIALSTYYFWQRKLFQVVTETEAVCFAEVPITSSTSEKIVATLHSGEIRVELHAGASSELIRSLVNALKLC